MILQLIFIYKLYIKLFGIEIPDKVYLYTFYLFDPYLLLSYAV